jgi:hypothetical protein
MRCEPLTLTSRQTYAPLPHIIYVRLNFDCFFDVTCIGGPVVGGAIQTAKRSANALTADAHIVEGHELYPER